MALKFRDARLEDLAVIAGLQNAAAGALTARFGDGPWSGLTTERGAAASMQNARFRVGVMDRRVVTVLRVATRKPWAIDVSYFTPVGRPLYGTSMAVSVAHQGKGLGREAIRDALRVTEEWPADSLRLDAWAGPGGAGDFYRKCGFAERGRVVYKGTPLVYFERLV
jgi:GNAT superfamily N-acetyltransferase